MKVNVQSETDAKRVAKLVTFETHVYYLETNFATTRLPYGTSLSQAELDLQQATIGS